MPQAHRKAGSITIEPLEHPPLHFRSPNQASFAATYRYIWRPSSLIAAELPQDFELSLLCLVDPSGIRHFVPRDDTETFVLQAMQGGRVLIDLHAELTEEQRQGFRTMRLAYQLSGRLRESFYRTFRTERDLYLPATVRLGGGAHVLSELVGCDGKGAGEAWAPSELINRGRESAEQLGMNDPDTATCIRLGLREAAKKNPLVDEPSKCLKIVRLGLFDLGPDSDRVTQADIERVFHRLADALNDHRQNDDSAFHIWFFENFDSLVKQIGKKKNPDGPIPRSIVRRAILEIVFLAYSHVGQCVNLQMREFMHCTPEPLNEIEHGIFAALYLRQPMLGDLPFVLLRKRLGFLADIVADIFENPTDKHLWAVLLRMLQYYGEMASKKREADRRYKQQSPHRNIYNRSGAVFSLDEAQDQAAKSDRNLFQDIAAELRELRQAKCRCATSTRWRAETVEGQADDEPQIKFRETCELCGHSEEYSVPREQFAAIGKRLMEERAGEYW